MKDIVQWKRSGGRRCKPRQLRAFLVRRGGSATRRRQPESLETPRDSLMMDFAEVLIKRLPALQSRVQRAVAPAMR